MIFAQARISNRTQNLKFGLHTFPALAQMRFLLKFRDPCGVLSRTGTESGLKYSGKGSEKSEREVSAFYLTYFFSPNVVFRHIFYSLKLCKFYFFTEHLHIQKVGTTQLHKAFNSLSHNTLTGKLRKWGLDEWVVRWIWNSLDSKVPEGLSVAQDVVGGLLLVVSPKVPHWAQYSFTYSSVTWMKGQMPF